MDRLQGGYAALLMMVLVQISASCRTLSEVNTMKESASSRVRDCPVLELCLPAEPPEGMSLVRAVLEVDGQTSLIRRAAIQSS